MNVIDQVVRDEYALYCGDSAEIMAGIPDNSIDLSVSSPPFAQLYTYSASERDLGNCSSDAEFFAHYAYLIDHIYRVTKPGRVAAVHVFDIPAMLVRDGYIGLKDFSGEVIRAYIRSGWIYDSRVPIDKNQEAQSIRTYAKGLTLRQMNDDRTWSRPGLPDYILKFRKPGDNIVPVRGGVTNNEWIALANPTWPEDRHDRAAEGGALATWFGIKETDTLTRAPARENDDERHICPLQLNTIERCIRLWSNPGENVFDPFAGIGSVPYVAVKHGRRGVGIELKPSYYRCAVKNLARASASMELPLEAALRAAS